MCWAQAFLCQLWHAALRGIPRSEERRGNRGPLTDDNSVSAWPQGSLPKAPHHGSISLLFPWSCSGSGFDWHVFNCYFIHTRIMIGDSLDCWLLWLCWNRGRCIWADPEAYSLCKGCLLARISEYDQHDRGVMIQYMLSKQGLLKDTTIVELTSNNSRICVCICHGPCKIQHHRTIDWFYNQKNKVKKICTSRKKLFFIPESVKSWMWWYHARAATKSADTHLGCTWHFISPF